jgi:hypothetical protein
MRYMLRGLFLAKSRARHRGDAAAAIGVLRPDEAWNTVGADNLARAAVNLGIDPTELLNRHRLAGPDAPSATSHRI